VKLLFDENLSPNLPLILATDYAKSVHVRSVGTAAIAELLMRERDRVGAFGHEAEASFLILSLNYSSG
jgi:hypothetical protein